MKSLISDLQQHCGWTVCSRSDYEGICLTGSGVLIVLTEDSYKYVYEDKESGIRITSPNYAYLKFIDEIRNFNQFKEQLKKYGITLPITLPYGIKPLPVDTRSKVEKFLEVSYLRLKVKLVRPVIRYVLRRLNSLYPKSLYKIWRNDCGMWEECIQLSKWFHVYRYTIWIEGKVYERIKIIRPLKYN